MTDLERIERHLEHIAAGEDHRIAELLRYVRGLRASQADLEAAMALDGEQRDAAQTDPMRSYIARLERAAEEDGR